MQLVWPKIILKNCRKYEKYFTFLFYDSHNKQLWTCSCTVALGSNRRCKLLNNSNNCNDNAFCLCCAVNDLKCFQVHELNQTNPWSSCSCMLEDHFFFLLNWIEVGCCGINMFMKQAEFHVQHHQRHWQHWSIKAKINHFRPNQQLQNNWIYCVENNKSFIFTLKHHNAAKTCWQRLKFFVFVTALWSAWDSALPSISGHHFLLLSQRSPVHEYSCSAWL